MENSNTLNSGLTLAIGTLNRWKDEFYILLPNLFFGLFLLIFIILLAYGLDRLISAYFARKSREDLGHILGSFGFWALCVFGMLLTLTIIVPSIKPSNMLASLGIGSLAFGFAFKDILQNWLAGLLILLRMPFRRGDQIQVGEAEGNVMRIEPRATIIRTYDGRDVVVPNTTIYTSIVKVHTSQEQRRTEINLTVGYTYDIRLLTNIIENSLSQIEEVLKNPAPQVLCWELGSTSLVIKIRWWINSQRSQEVTSRSRVVRAIKEAFDANDIDPTDPQLIYYRKTDDTRLMNDTEKSKNNKVISVPSPPKIKVAKNDPESEMPKDDVKEQTIISD